MSPHSIDRNQTARNRLTALSGLIGLLGLMSHDSAIAQITPDTTWGAENTIATPNAIIQGQPATLIEGGAIRNTNLFHSFQIFNIGNGERVYFANPSGVQTILSRITGNTPSNILGTLGVNGSANLFLINPNGILFGPNARLDVNGSFVATTASAIQFGNQGFFTVVDPRAPALLTINPSAFLFNQAATGQIENQSIVPAGVDPAGFNRSGLRVADGHSLLLVGGDVLLNGGRVSAVGGNIELVSIGSTGSVGLVIDQRLLRVQVPEDLARSDVALARGADVYVRASGGGNIRVIAQDFQMANDSSLRAGIPGNSGFAGAQAGTIEIDARGGTQLTSNSTISNTLQSGATGNSGNIYITSNTISLTDGAILTTAINGRGNAGNIRIIANDHVSFDGVGSNGTSSGVYSTVNPGAVGDAGTVRIATGSFFLTNGGTIGTSTRGTGNAGEIAVVAQGAVTVDGEGSNRQSSGLYSNVFRNAVGDAGAITITANALTFTNGGVLNSTTLNRGDGGRITLNIQDATTVGGISRNGGSTGFFSGLLRGSIGQGGDMQITTGSLTVSSGAIIGSGSLGTGNGGNIEIVSRGSVTLDGQGANRQGSSISSEVASRATGDAGRMSITADSLTITNGAQLNSTTNGIGNGGDIAITTRDTVSLDGVGRNRVGSAVFSFVNDQGVGKAGNITVNTGSLFLTNGAELNSFTRGRGKGGNINIAVREVVSVDGVGSNGLSSNILSSVNSGGVGDGGTIDINTGSLLLTNGGRVQTTAFGAGDAGRIQIVARDRVWLDGVGDLNLSSGIFSSTNRDLQNAGTITITTNELAVTAGALLNSSTRAAGRAGQVEIIARDRVLIDGVGNDGTRSAVLTRVEQVSTGDGGDIRLNTNSLIISNGGEVGATTRGTGKGGTITVNARTFGALSGGQILTNTGSRGDAGNIVLHVSDRVLLVGSNPDYTAQLAQFGTARLGTTGAFSGLFANTDSGASGTGGTITLNTGELRIQDGGQITVGSRGTGTGGELAVTARSLFLNNQGQLIAETSSASGGNITLTVRDLLLMRRNSLISATAGTVGASGDGGNIRIDARFVVAHPLENSDIIANAFSGRGGRVDINTLGLFGFTPRTRSDLERALQTTDPAQLNSQRLPTSDITAISQTSPLLSGSVAITTPNLDPTQALVELPDVPVDVSRLVSQELCAATEGSQFVITGRGGVPDAPTSTLNAGAVWEDWRITEEEKDEVMEWTGDRANGSSSTFPRSHAPTLPHSLSTSHPVPPTLIEAQGWVSAADGSIWLVANSTQTEPHSPWFVLPNCQSTSQTPLSTTVPLTRSAILLKELLPSKRMDQ